MNSSKTEPSWSLLITRAENGYVFRWKTLLDDGTVRVSSRVVEEAVYKNDEARTATHMLWSVLDFFGIYQGIDIKVLEDDLP